MHVFHCFFLFLLCVWVCVFSFCFVFFWLVSIIHPFIHIFRALFSLSPFVYRPSVLPIHRQKFVRFANFRGLFSCHHAHYKRFELSTIRNNNKKKNNNNNTFAKTPDALHFPKYSPHSPIYFARFLSRSRANRTRKIALINKMIFLCLKHQWVTTGSRPTLFAVRVI